MFDNESAEPKPQNYAMRSYYGTENRFKAELCHFLKLKYSSIPV